MVDYISHITSSSGGSDTLSNTTGVGAGTSTTSSSTRSTRVRTVRLVRPPCSGILPPPGLTCKHGPGLGFSIRGGREHGTGFFVSQVENGSEAHRQGLKVGDQIIRVNGFTVEDAIHKEVLQLISNHTHLTLKVRSVGMIPVKDKSTDPLSWQIIPDFTLILSESPPLEEKHHDVRISISVAQRAKLGCGICKGPEWKPGIFVQFTKEGGIARDAGLRPGDQILYCNNVDFTDLSFNEAVNIMKTSRQLDLVVRKGAGSELFPGESSGYNSSASSVTGDQSPSWSESKRLSIVKEESMELEDRLSHLDFQRYKPKTWEKISYDWDENPRQFKPTIINLSENGTTIKNNGTVEECQPNIVEEETEKEKIPPVPSKLLMDQQPPETKTVVVEVHRSDVEEEKTDDSSIKKSLSISSCSSSSNSCSLSSALSLELQRRSERNKESQKRSTIDEDLQKNKVIKSAESDKKNQHQQLMDEFRKAHRKMFSSSIDDENVEKHNKGENNDPLKDRQSQLSQRRSTIANPEGASERLTPFINSIRYNNNSTTQPPPPPPPMPMSCLDNDMNTNAKLKPSTKPKAPPVPQKNFHQPLPPPCPTPDYDTLSLNSVISTSGGTLPRQNTSQQNKQQNVTHRNGLTSSSSNKVPPPPPPLANLTQRNSLNSNGSITNDTVDMESLESFKLNHPNVLKPKPPNTYFNKPKLTAQLSIGSISSQSSQSSTNTQSCGGTTMKNPRPISVTIGEYSSGTCKRQPINKFDFLCNSSSSEDQTDSQTEEPITSRLASELAQTLSRSNLKKRTESPDTIKPQTNGTVTISVNNDKTSPFSNSNSHKILTKSQSTDVNAFSRQHLENTLSKALANRVTIKISESDVKNMETTTSPSPSSILKNGNGNHHCSSQHKPLVHQKSITFGEITTVINDRPMHVT